MRKLIVFISIVFPSLLSAQQSDTTLSDHLKKGTFVARTRAFMMSTVNEKELSDYYASAIGVGFDYTSPEIKKFRLSLGGMFVYNIWSSDMTKTDPTTNMPNRYEIGLFDIEHPSNKNDINRLEQFNLQYRIKTSYLRAGRMLLKTPFVNPQDGRMSPTFAQGIWMEVNEIKKTVIQGGWISGISPRSTASWFSVANSIGLYPGGINPDGTRSQYMRNLNSNGTAMLGIDIKGNYFSFSGWETYLENISNTLLLQLEGIHKNDNHHYYSGLQFTRQDALGNGGNADPAKQYITPGTFINIYSGRIGAKLRNMDINLNGTYMSDQGRFLMPREWGRDPFYTFLPRERNEGFGDLKAVSLNVIYSIPGTRLKTWVGIGEYHLPDIANTRLNKYAMPSYRQLNVDLRYPFNGFLKGADLQFLYVYKQNLGKDYENPKNILNKVNMNHFNLVFNYRFESTHR